MIRRGSAYVLLLSLWLPPASAQTERGAPDAIPEGPVGDAIRLGERILTHTPQTVPEYREA